MNESRVRKPIRLFVFLLMLVLLILAIQPALASGVAGAQAVRFATFNASLNRNFEGQLIADLSTPDNAQAKTIAEIVHVHPCGRSLLRNWPAVVRNGRIAAARHSRSRSAALRRPARLARPHAAVSQTVECSR